MARPVGSDPGYKPRPCPTCKEREKEPGKTYCYICLPLYYARQRANKKARAAPNGPEQPST
jgi:hypothetical protein